MSGGLGLGLALVASGLAAMLVVWVLLRLLPSNQPDVRVPLSSFNHLEDSDQKDAIIIVQSGGRVEYMNKVARQLFNIQEDEQTDLERLARQARPSSEFLSLFSQEDQKQISVGSQLTETTSYRVPGLFPLMMIVLRNLDLAPALSDDG